MTVLKIKSFASTSEGTFGVMFYQNKLGEWIPFCVTLERKWQNNEKGKSCIPRPSEYLCKRVTSPTFGNTFEIMVEGRSAILFHKGNLDDDSHGCVLVGEMFDPIYDKAWQGWSPGVAASGKGFAEFLDKLKNENEFKLVIEEA